MPHLVDLREVKKKSINQNNVATMKRIRNSKTVLVMMIYPIRIIEYIFNLLCQAKTDSSEEYFYYVSN